MKGLPISTRWSGHSKEPVLQIHAQPNGKMRGLRFQQMSGREKPALMLPGGQLPVPEFSGTATAEEGVTAFTQWSLVRLQNQKQPLREGAK